MDTTLTLGGVGNLIRSTWGIAQRRHPCSWRQPGGRKEYVLGLANCTINSGARVRTEFFGSSEWRWEFAMFGQGSDF
jgi:hypothetical protein